jgi:hypothetical protein
VAVDLVFQLAQGLVTLIVIIVIAVAIPFLFMLVFSFAYGSPAPSTTRRAAQPIMADQSNDESEAEVDEERHRPASA